MTDRSARKQLLATKCIITPDLVSGKVREGQTAQHFMKSASFRGCNGLRNRPFTPVLTGRSVILRRKCLKVVDEFRTPSAFVPIRSRDPSFYLQSSVSSSPSTEETTPFATYVTTAFLCSRSMTASHTLFASLFHVSTT